MFSTTNTLDSTCHAQPRPTLLLACGKNFLPVSWHMPVSKSPFRYAVAMRHENETYKLLKEKKNFSLNFLDYEYVQAYDMAGSMHGGDKFSATGLQRKKAEKIQSTLIEESYMIYECEVKEVVSFGDHDVFVADVICIHNKQSENVSPVLFQGKGYYETTTQSPKRMPRDADSTTSVPCQK